MEPPPKDEDADSTQRNMKLYKIFRLVMTACNQNNIKQIAKLKQNYRLLEEVEILQSPPENISSQVFKNKVRSALLEICCRKCGNDGNDLVFFVAAAFNLNRLLELVEGCDFDQTRDSDSVILFALKYGNIAHDDFFNCMKILIDAGFDINQFDINGKSPVDYICLLFEKNKSDTKIVANLEILSETLLQKGLYKIDNPKTKDFIEKTLNKDLSSYSFREMNEQTLLFYWLSKEKHSEFLKFKNISQHVNCSNTEYTLLQFACKKSEKSLRIIELLLNKKADPNRVTKLQPLTPLELSALNNHQSIFKKLLEHSEITVQTFNNMVKWRSSPVKLKFFEMFLESDKLNPEFTYEKTGNTPLHYAIRFSHKKAIQKLLKKGKSLTVLNLAGKSPLNMIDASDLETYFDSCLALDTYSDFTSNDYKMQFRFKSLIGDNGGEVEIISKIATNENLEHLLTHPLINIFIELKWFKVKAYYWTVLIIQALLFLALSASIYFSSLPLCISFLLINSVPKLLLLLVHSKPFWKIKPTTLHEFGEILLVFTIIGGFIYVEFGAFAFIEMSVLFLLTAGYHPKISKWSVMLQTVFKSFSILLLFFSLIIIAFACAFHVIFRRGNEEIFKSFWKSIFMAYVMSTGDLNTIEVQFNASNFLGYFIFVLFAVCISVVIINFWTGVAVTDIDKIEKYAEMNAFKNISVFLFFVQKHLNVFRKCLPNPLLFTNAKNEYKVDFYVNKENQFDEKGFPGKLGKSCLDKIRSNCHAKQNSSNEKNILMKLDEQYAKILHQNGSSEKNILMKLEEHAKILENILKKTSK